MIIGIDGYYLTYRQRKGIGTYLYHLVKHLCAILSTEDQIIVFSPVPLHDSLDRVSNVHGHRLVSQYVWEQWMLPNMLRHHKVDVVHCPANTRPLHVNVPIVVSVHDLIMFLPSKRTPYERYVKFCTRRSISESNHLITVSNASMSDIKSAFNTKVPIDVIYPGVPVEHQTQFKHGDVQNRVIHFATPEPRKNTLLVIHAARRIPEIDVVLIGMTAEQVSETWNVALTPNVICRGYVSQEEKLKSLSTSLALVYVSNYEGFGFPVLEAMVESCPVIVSKTDAVLEVGGNAVIPTENNADQLAAVIRKCAADQAFRSELVRMGYQNLSRFDWHQTAQKTYEVYKRVGRSS